MGEPGDADLDQKKPSHDTASAIKGWSEAVSALLKAALYGAGIMLVGTIIVTAIWRHINSQVLVLETTPLAEETLRSLGADVNLQLAVGDAINERINSISQIILPRGLNLAENGNNENFSLRPIHLEGSTGDITHIFDFVFGRPPRPTIGLDVYCGSADCLKAPGAGMRLLVSLPGADGFRLASFPLVGGEGALKRSLHQAIGDPADTVLGRYEPLPASVWFLNRPNAFAGFLDQLNPDLIRAVGAAAASRRDAHAGCLPDLVVGMSLMNRGEFEAGRELEVRAAQGTDLRCSVQGYTNIIFALTPYALNYPDELVRQSATDHIEEARKKLVDLHINRGQIDDLNYYRIPSAYLDVKMADILQRTKTGHAFFLSRTPKGLPENAAADELDALLKEELMAPPGRQPQMRHGSLGLMIEAMRTGVPRENIKGRLRLAKALMDLIHSDENLETAPRALFMLEGKLAMEIGVDANDALIDEPSESAELSNLAQALDPDDSSKPLQPVRRMNLLYISSMKYAAVAFENALGTEGLPSLVEPFSKIDAITKLGDAHFVAGLTNVASSDYARAAAMFTEMDEPVGEAGRLVGAMAHWAAMQVFLGACNDHATAPDERWISAWRSLGWAPPDVCEFYKNGQAVPADAGQPLLTRMIRDVLYTCNRPVESANPSKRVPLQRMLDLQDCINTWGAMTVAQKYSSWDFDQEVMKSISARDAKARASGT